jgi:hypothetical protein
MINAHVDPFGPMHPFHYLLQLPSMLFSASPKQGATCMLNGGALNNREGIKVSCASSTKLLLRLGE